MLSMRLAEYLDDPHSPMWSIASLTVYVASAAESSSGAEDDSAPGSTKDCASSTRAVRLLLCSATRSSSSSRQAWRVHMTFSHMVPWQRCQQRHKLSWDGTLGTWFNFTAASTIDASVRRVQARWSTCLLSLM
jgi:hypothetical protein